MLRNGGFARGGENTGEGLGDEAALCKRWRATSHSDGDVGFFVRVGDKEDRGGDRVLGGDRVRGDVVVVHGNVFCGNVVGDKDVASRTSLTVRRRSGVDGAPVLLVLWSVLWLSFLLSSEVVSLDSLA